MLHCSEKQPRQGTLRRDVAATSLVYHERFLWSAPRARAKKAEGPIHGVSEFPVSLTLIVAVALLAIGPVAISAWCSMSGRSMSLRRYSIGGVGTSAWRRQYPVAAVEAAREAFVRVVGWRPDRDAYGLRGAPAREGPVAVVLKQQNVDGRPVCSPTPTADGTEYAADAIPACAPRTSYSMHMCEIRPANGNHIGE